MDRRIFHASLHPRPTTLPAAAPLTVAGVDWPSLAADQAVLAAGFPLSFETVATRLEQLPRMFLEPDGSLVWVGSSAEATWQLDGVLYDRAGRLLYLELKGWCPAEPFDALLRTLDWPETAVLVQWMAQGRYLDERVFRQLAGLAPTDPASGS